MPYVADGIGKSKAHDTKTMFADAPNVVLYVQP